MNIIINQFISTKEEDTEKVAIDFVQYLKNGDVVILNGPLGCGKTFFVKKIAKYYKIPNSSSPTFALVNEYIGERKIYHFDFYRINSINELYDIGFVDYLSDKEAISFIEWGELFPEILPKEKYEVSFEFNNDDTRKITIIRYE
jgi:tRNA threonylcarbamoyladenosine biosynthesis protein TsaE